MGQESESPRLGLLSAPGRDPNQPLNGSGTACDEEQFLAEFSSQVCGFPEVWKKVLGLCCFLSIGNSSEKFVKDSRNLSKRT